MDDLELVERLTRLEAAVAEQIENKAELRGFVEGRVASIAEDIRVTHEEQNRQFERIMKLLLGNGDNPGVPERLRKLERGYKLFSAVATSVLTLLVIEVIIRKFTP